MKRDYINMSSEELFRCVMHDIQTGKLESNENLQLAIDYASDLEIEIEMLRSKVSYVKEVVSDIFKND